MNVGSHCFGVVSSFQRAACWGTPGIQRCCCWALSGHGGAILDITDDVWDQLVSWCMALLFLCVKLASKMDCHSLLFLKGPPLVERFITHLVPELVISLRGKKTNKKKGRFCFGFYFCFHLAASAFTVTKVYNKHCRKGLLVLPSI